MPDIDVKDVDVNIEGEGKDVIDPGIKEGQKKDPRVEQDKITPDMPRFQEVYKNWKRSEERIKELEEKIAKIGDNASLINEMRRHNASLEETLKQISSNKDDNKYDTVLKELESKLSELKELKKQAREKADFDAETRIDDSIADLKLDIRDVKKAVEHKKQQPPSVPKVDDTMSEEDRAEYELWISDNEWFSKDSKKRAAAISIEKKVISEPNFRDASIPEVLEEVGKRVEEKFKPVEGKNAVEGSDKTGSTKIPGSVRLSKTELDISTGLGITPERYARQKALMSARRTK